MSDQTPQSPGNAREEFLTARQLAAILQVSESTVHRLARRGRIPSVRITPRLTRFHLQAVREALDGATKRTRRNATAAAADGEAESAQLSFSDLL
ncbi:MAG TPA: helix-turn-helix domain-containing protein [Pyrinomonadaceae bacterium]